MMVNRKNICVIFLLLAGLIILHSTIPHHHHFEESSTHNESAQCNNEQEAELPEDENSHCHAFNDLIITKTASLNFKYENLPDFILNGNSYSDLHPKINVFIKPNFIEQKIPLFKQYSHSYALMRAPPIFS